MRIAVRGEHEAGRREPEARLERGEAVVRPVRVAAEELMQRRERETGRLDARLVGVVVRDRALETGGRAPDAALPSSVHPTPEKPS